MNISSSKPFSVIEEGNTQVEILKNIAKMKAFTNNIQQDIHLNKIVYLNEELEKLLKWPEL